MPSRRKRKRERSKTEATAQSPGTCGGWGNGLPTTLSDLGVFGTTPRKGGIAAREAIIAIAFCSP